MSDKNTEYILAINLPNKQKHPGDDEVEDKTNKTGEVRNKIDKELSDLYQNTSDKGGQVYKSCFMDIHLDAVYNEIDLKNLPKQINYPNLLNVSIYINSCSLNQINFTYLRDAFSNYKLLQNLKIYLQRDGNMNSYSYKQLGSIFKLSPQLKELTLSIEQNNIYNLKQLYALFDGIKSLTELAKMKLAIKRQNKVMTKESVQCIGNSLKHLTKLVDLTLYLNCSTNDQSFNIEISKLLSYLSQLQKLILIVNCDTKNQQASSVGVISVFKSLSTFKHLKDFSFSMKNISVNPTILEEAFKFLPSLQSFRFFTKFSISKNQIWEIKTQQCLRKIFPCLYDDKQPLKIKQEYNNIFKNLTKIENISFSIHDLTDEGLISLGDEISSFTNLKILSILINPESQENSVKILPQSNTDLFDFHEDYVTSSNKQADQGICSLAQGITSLKYLRILKLQIDNLKIKEKGAQELKGCFKYLQNLNHLVLKIGNNYSGKGSFLKTMMEGIQNLLNLKILELEVESFIFSTEYTEGLANCFKNLSSLTSISLQFTKSYNVMPDDNQVSCLANIFQNLHNLTFVKLIIQYPNSAQMISNQLFQHLKKVQNLHLEIFDTEISRQNLQKLIQNMIQCCLIQTIFFRLQSNKDDNQIFDKFLNKLLFKKQKFFKRLVRYSFKN